MERELSLTLRITEDCYEFDLWDYETGDCVQHSALKTEDWKNMLAKANGDEVVGWLEVMEELQEEE